jgi:hypothetical protein
MREAYLRSMMRKKRRLAFAEDLVVWGFRRRYLREMRRNEGISLYGEVTADAVARLSIGGVHHLLETLRDERKALRERGDHGAADSLTSAIRDIDSRMQILDDLLH